jgi:hypothetical protein
MRRAAEILAVFARHGSAGPNPKVAGTRPGVDPAIIV